MAIGLYIGSSATISGYGAAGSVIAALFWICAMLILVSLAFSWNFVQTRIYKHQTASQSSHPSQSKPGSAKQKSPQEEQAEMARQLAAEGAAVVVNYASSRAGADQVVAEIAAKG